MAETILTIESTLTFRAEPTQTVLDPKGNPTAVRIALETLFAPHTWDAEVLDNLSRFLAGETTRYFNSDLNRDSASTDTLEDWQENLGLRFTFAPAPEPLADWELELLLGAYNHPGT